MKIMTGLLLSFATICMAGAATDLHRQALTVFEARSEIAARLKGVAQRGRNLDGSGSCTLTRDLNGVDASVTLGQADGTEKEFSISEKLVATVDKTDLSTGETRYSTTFDVSDEGGERESTVTLTLSTQRRATVVAIQKNLDEAVRCVF